MSEKIAGLDGNVHPLAVTRDASRRACGGVGAPPCRELFIDYTF